MDYRLCRHINHTPTSVLHLCASIIIQAHKNNFIVHTERYNIILPIFLIAFWYLYVLSGILVAFRYFGAFWYLYAPQTTDMHILAIIMLHQHKFCVYKGKRKLKFRLLVNTLYTFCALFVFILLCKCLQSEFF